MKRFTCITLVISGVCALLGGLFILAGSLMGAGLGECSDLFMNGFFSTNWYQKDADADVSSDGTAVRKEESFPASEIEKLDFELAVGTLNIEENLENPDQILVVTEVKNAKVDVKQEEDCLEIIEDTGKLFWKHHSIVKITVYLPKDKVYQEIDAEVGVGSMLSELEKLSAQEVSLVSGTGEIHINGIEVLNDLEVECGVGEVDLGLYGQKEDFNYALDCGVGEILIDQEQYSGLGNTLKLPYQSDKNATVDCGVGSVRIQFRK